MKRMLVVFAVAGGLLFAGLTTSAWATQQIGNFHITFVSSTVPPQGDPNVDDGWENPQTGELWTFYGEAPGNPFWNQWWYDDPPTWDRWKEIFYDVTIESWPADPQNPPPEADRVIVALNWSNMEFPETGPDGLFPLPEAEWAIERQVIFDGPVASNEVVQLKNDEPFIIPEYNPEWVSMDVWVEYANPEPVNRIEIFGTILHECVPEPNSLLLLGLAGLGILAGGRRKQA